MSTRSGPHPPDYGPRSPARVAEQILLVCRARACTLQEIARVVPVTAPTLRRHVERLVAAELLIAEAPSRRAGRLITPYRTAPRAYSGGRRGSSALVGVDALAGMPAGIPAGTASASRRRSGSRLAGRV